MVSVIYRQPTALHSSNVSDLQSWSPRERPRREALVGERVRLEPLARAHAPALYAASHGPGTDPALWDFLPYGPFADADEYGSWVKTNASADDPLFFTIIEGPDPVGVASFLRIEPVHGVIEIGHIWFGAALQRTPAATEAIFLLARHAFDDLGYRRLEWKCDAGNRRSRGAAERFGFRFEGVFRQHMVVKGRNRDTAWYAILDSEWPSARAAFESWLDASNFDADGSQRRALAELRAGLPDQSNV
jgi:RimJ/RimL family protein N-acetyltransferase